MNRKFLGILLTVVTQGRTADLACAICHPKESAAFTGSAMGRSIGSPVHTVPAGRVAHSESGSTIQVTWANGRMEHRLSELGLQADYAIDYQIGAGNVGHSYFSRLGDYLLQSPASFYRRYGWDISPGFKDLTILDFDRVLGSACLFCHTGNPDFISRRRLAAHAKLEPIGCVRCHGDVRQHLQRPSKLNIVNPATLQAGLRDGVCEQCHLEGVARVLNPGKTWQDFKPGDPLEQTLSVYVEVQQRPGAKAVSQVEQLAESRCAKESGGRLWCGTCHDPHAAIPADRTTELKAICSSCHPKLSPAKHPSARSECATCHMPRLNPNDVAHAASTDHRILARPDAQNEQSSGAIRVWREPPAELKPRNLGLAQLQASASPPFQSLAVEGERLLVALPAEQMESDPAVLVALGDLGLSHGNPEKAASFFLKASQLMPLDGEYALYAGIALKQQGDVTKAVECLQRAIEIDPSLQRAYLELSALYTRQADTLRAAAVLKRFLRWNPQSILARSMLEPTR